MTNLRVSLASSACLAAFLATPATAQNAPVQNATAVPATGAVQDIVVTAQRRSERLQEVPLSVSAVSGAALARSNVTSVVDIGRVIPSAVFQTNNGTVTTFVRGIGNAQTPIGNEASNALYIDGVYYGRITPVAMLLNNVDRVEVLKGPQGTLFGRNSTSGLVQIITRDPKPGSNWTGGFDLDYGNYQTVQSGAHLSGGLGEKIGLDLSAVYLNQNDGFGKNPYNGDDWQKERAFAARAKLLFQATETTRITLAADYNKAYSTKGTQQPLFVPGATEADPRGASGYPDGSGLVPFLGRDYAHDADVFTRTRDRGGSAKIEQELSFAKIIDIAAYRSVDQTQANDVDVSDQPGFYSNLPSYFKQFSNELQLQSLSTSRISWTLGGFFYRQKYGYSDKAIIAGEEIGPGVTLVVPAGGVTKSYAVYGQATVPVIDKVHLTLGGRYTRDELRAHGRVDLSIAGVGLVPGVEQSSRVNYNKFTYKAVLDYKPTRDLMIYASASRGAKSGVYNLLTFDPNPVKPETLDAYEIGVKSELFDRHLRLNAAAFYYKLHNPQVFLVPRPGTNALTNAGSADVKGLEIEAEASPTSRLSIRANVVLLDAKFTDFKNAPFYEPNPNPPFGLLPPVAMNGDGQDLSRAPKFSGNAAADYTLPLGGHDLTVGANYAYVGKFYWDVDNRFSGGKYGLLDAHITYALSENLKVTAYGTNLINKFYYDGAFEVTGSGGAEGVLAAPRRYGVRLNYAFN